MSESLDYFLPYQLRWIADESAMALGEKSRRIGWTYASSYRAVRRRVQGHGSLYFTSVDQTAGREFIDYCKTWCRVMNVVAVESDEQELIEERELHTKVLTFANGLKIVSGSSNPNFYRSKGGDADADEYAFHRDGRELLKAMHATAMFWGYQLRLWSTHNGEVSYFNTLLQQARAGKIKAAVHRVTILDAVEQGIVEKIRGLKSRDDKARQEWLDELRSTVPDEDVWHEEYLCQPSSENSALLGYELMRPCEVANLQLFDVTSGQIGGGGSLYAGYDVGRKKDLSALWVVEPVGDVLWTRVLRTFDRVNFTAQEDVLHTLLRNPSLKRLCIDSTGIGLQMSERLQSRWGKYRVEAVNFTPAVKSELAMPLRRLFEDKSIRVPMDAAVREDLHSVRKIVTAAGNVRFDADRSDDGHADRFWSLALATHAADSKTAPLRSEAQKPRGW